MTAPSCACDAARALLAEGFSPIPVPRASKNPGVPNWQDLKFAPAEIEQRFGKESNVGALLGKGGLVDVDLDHPLAARVAQLLLPRTDRIHGRPSKPDSHFWYVVQSPPQSQRFQFNGSGVLVELRTNGQTLVPPSLHPSGEPYEASCWGKPTLVDGDVLARRVALVGAAALLALKWPTNGSRHDFSLALAGALLRSGLNAAEAKALVRAASTAAGDEEADLRAKDVDDTAARLAQHQNVTGWPTVIEHVGKDAADAVCRWLGLVSVAEAAVEEAPREGTASYYRNWAASFIPASDFIAQTTVAQPWIIRGIVRPGTYTHCFGYQGTGKSRLWWQIGYAIAAGLDSVLGFEVCEHGPVLFLECDMAPEETRALILDAEQEGLVHPDLIVPSEFGVLDVRTPAGQDFLHHLNGTFRPVLVIVDTVSDVYTRRDLENVNDSIRDVRRVFRVAFPQAGISFQNHVRKASNRGGETGEHESDDALGGGDWARHAVSDLKLGRVSGTHEQVKLKLLKTRGPLLFDEKTLARTEHGFFAEQVNTAAWSADEALVRWPKIPNLKTDPGSCRSLAAVFRAIHEAIPHVTPDALKKARRRRHDRGETYVWERGTFLLDEAA